MDAMLFFRLLLNTLLTLTGILLTLGLNQKLNHKLKIYLQLIAWHLKGCP
jgi:hypothetical protein